MAARYQKRIQWWERLGIKKSSTQEVMLIVSPWKETPTPLFAFEVALMMRHMGRRVGVLLDFSNLDGNASKTREVDAIRKVAQMLPKDVTVQEMADDANDIPLEIDLSDARRIVYQHAIMRERGESSVENFFKDYPQAEERVALHIGRAKSRLVKTGRNFLLLPGGVYGTSASYVAAANAKEIDFTTYDSGNKMIVLAHNGVAGHQHDISKSHALLSLLLERSPVLARRVRAWAGRELDERIGGAGNYSNFQSVPASANTSMRCDILVPLNLRWDAAALGRQDLFSSVTEWINFLTETIGKLTGVSVVFRQHPAERAPSFRSSDDYNAIIGRNNPDPDRIRFVSADDPVNTYNLLRGGCKLVLPHTSSMGVEAGMLGIPVVLAGPAYYESFPFAQRARSIEEYRKLIQAAIECSYTPSNKAKDIAHQVYFLTQQCNLVSSVFNAETASFWGWINKPPAELWEREELQDMQTALMERLPYSYIRAKRWLLN